MPIDALFLGGSSIDIIGDYESVGGSVTNSAVISAKLGLKTALLSRIGKDDFGNFAIDYLRRSKIDTKGVIQDSDIHTPVAIAKINESGVAKYKFYKNAPKDSVVPLKTAPRHLLNTCKVFHTGSSYSYQKETFEETLKFIKYLKKRNVFISYDPNIRPYSIKNKKEVKNRVLTLLKLADLAKLSEIDLEYLTGKKSPLKGMETLKKQVNCEIVLTLGSKGSAYMSLRGTKCRSNLIKIPAFKVKIADTIGAGDGFTAGLIYKLIEQGRGRFFANMKANMTFASAISALICTKKGSHQGLKNLKQVNSFLSDYSP